MKFAIVIISTLSIRFFKEIILINIIFDISNNYSFLYRILDLRLLFSPQFWRIQIYRCKISKPVKRFEKIQSVIFLDKKLEYCENRWSRDARVGNFSNIAAQISLHSITNNEKEKTSRKTEYSFESYSKLC